MAWTTDPKAPIVRHGRWTPNPAAPEPPAPVNTEWHPIRTRYASTDLGIGMDDATARVLAAAQDLGHGLDTATGRMRGTAYADLGVGTDRATPVAHSTALSDLGVGLDQVTGKMVGTAFADLGVGLDLATIRALGTAHGDLGHGTDQANVSKTIGTAADLGTGHDQAAPRALGTAFADLGHSLDQSAGRMRGTAYTDLGHGLDLATVRPLGSGRDLGVGQDRSAGRPRGSGRDLGTGFDSGSGRWIDRWSGSRAALTGDASDWEWNLNWTVIGNTSGVVNFSVTHSWGSNFLQWVSQRRRLRITKNGAQIGSYVEQSHTTGGWSTTSTWNGITVTAGDLLRIEHWAESLYSQCRTCTVSAASMSVVSI